MGKKRSAAEAGHDASPNTGRKQQKNRPKKPEGKRHKPAGPKKALIFEPRPDWHAAELPALPSDDAAIVPSPHILAEIHKYAVSLLDEETAHYSASKKSSTNQFMTTFMASGTLEDKVSALTLLVQESPLHNRKAFDTLVGLARKKSRNHALFALGSLKDMLGQGVVLPQDRKLRAFAKQPALLRAFRSKAERWTPADGPPGQVQKVHLVVWAFEDWLKKAYFELLKVLESWCNDELEYSRRRALTFVWELLKDKPEQEENLLRLLINKLGDPQKKIASRASYLLLQLQLAHPAMKAVIVSAIESDLLFRPGQSLHARYYAIITLNQTVLSTAEEQVANKLLNIYFSLFISLLKTAQPAARKINDKSNRPVQGGGGKPGRKALQKLKLEEADVKSGEELREKLIAQILTGINRAFPYAVTDDATFETQMDTIFRVTHSSNFNTSIQALMLIQQISSSKQYSAERFYRVLYESLLDPRLLHSSKQIMYLNLLYRALKSDISVKRVKAFVKRLLQIIALHDPPFVCGVLYLIRELETSFPSIKSMLSDPEEDVDDHEEKFYDAVETSQPDEVGKESREDQTGIKHRSSSYDGRKRDPEHSHADQSCLWELIPLQAHFHPSVALFASRLLLSTPMPPKPDPTLHTLIHFLDRFAYRNAKTKPTGARGISMMQPLAGTSRTELLVNSRDGARTKAPLNTETFWKKRAEDVAADEVFFHTYFNQSNKKKSRKDRKPQHDEDGSDADVAGEDEIWKALVDSRPELDPAGGSDDEDMEMDDYDSAEELQDGPDAEDDLVDGRDGEMSSMGSDVDMDAFESDDDALIDSDDDVPVELEDPIQQANSKSTVADALGDSAAVTGKTAGKRRKTLKSLPAFASAEDYAQLVADDED